MRVRAFSFSLGTFRRRLRTGVIGQGQNLGLQRDFVLREYCIHFVSFACLGLTADGGGKVVRRHRFCFIGLVY